MFLASGPGIDTANPEAGAVPAGLVYSSDSEGIARIRQANEFAYRDSKGRLIRSAPLLARIRQLAIPPAYESVGICASPDGHKDPPWTIDPPAP